MKMVDGGGEEGLPKRCGRPDKESCKSRGFVGLCEAPSERNEAPLFR